MKKHSGSSALYFCLSFVLALLPPISFSNHIASKVSAQERGQRVKPSSTLLDRRIALVIGNAAYKDSPLTNPLNDAQDMAKVLREIGFNVEIKENLGQNEMHDAIQAFGEKIRNGGVGLFYYAGHAAQTNGVNYLIPIGAKISSESHIKLQSVPADDVLEQMQKAGNHLNVIILDACRNNPFPSSSRSLSQGLAKVERVSGTLIAYATQPGNTAADGSGRNSPYTTSLLEHILTPGLKIEELFKRVRNSVVKATDNRQTPWESTSLVEDFYFVLPKSIPISSGRAPQQRAEEAYWKAIEDSISQKDFRDYLKKYPKGTYVDAANAKINQLKFKDEDESYWRKIESSSNQKDFRDYLKKYPNGIYTDAAKAKISQLESKKTLPSVTDDLLSRENKIPPQENNPPAPLPQVPPTENWRNYEPVPNRPSSCPILPGASWLPLRNWWYGGVNGGDGIYVSSGIWLSPTVYLPPGFYVWSSTTLNTNGLYGTILPYPDPMGQIRAYVNNWLPLPGSRFSVCLDNYANVFVFYR